ncbi:MAG: glyoxylate/hydroxypyruvate reductase A, partial [Cyclobacteriaceae bacterium]|nr:glyoxylate/hydroxypyruvate reductase A [Cyclobacteriaceae bacterium]
LPLTSSTEDILNYNLFSRCKTGTYLVNLGRGGHLKEEDLIQAIQNGLISGAYLDVFKNEPLPADHLFWKMKEITITPHVASITRPESAVEVILENFKRHINNEELLYEVNRSKGY